VLVYVIQEQGRYQEAEQLQRQVISIYQGLGYGVESGQMVNAQSFLAQILNLRGQYDAASKLDQRRSAARCCHARAGQQRQRA
jgi:hypothetical protein